MRLKKNQNNNFLKLCFHQIIIFAKYIISLVFIFWLVALPLNSKNLDSLYHIWLDNTQLDTVRMIAYKDYMWNKYLYTNPDSASILADTLIEFASKIKSDYGKSIGYNVKGVSYIFRSDYPNALKYYEKALAINESLGELNRIASSLGNIGLLHSHQGNYPKALEYYERSLLISEKLEDLVGISKALHNMGIIYDNHGENKKALEYYKRSYSIKEKLGDKKGMSNSLVNIGIMTKQLGNFEEAQDYFEKSLIISEQMGDSQGIAHVLGNIGQNYQSQENYLSALQYYQKSYDVFEKIGDQKNISANLSYIGQMLYNLNNYNDALKNCSKALIIADSFNILEQQKHACDCLYSTYKALGNSKKALQFHEKMIKYRDSIYNVENTKKMTRLELQYEYTKKEDEAKAIQDKKDAIANQELKRQKLLRNSFITGFILVLVFAGVVFKQRNRISKEKARSEELLLNILPEETAKELKEKGSSDAKLIDHVTVIFTDFKGFTAMSELLSPKDLVEDLHQCFSAFDRIMEKYGIEKIKTIGDSYMAAGGLPTPNTTNPIDVVNAAMEMLEVIEQTKERKIAQKLPFFEIRIGIHTGPVVAGIVGVKKFQYDIWGDTVNTASRMESSGEIGKVNISQTTYNILKDNTNFTFESRGKIEAKGKGEIQMFFVSK